MRHIVFLATKERMLVEESGFSSSFGEIAPDRLPHPDAPSEEFSFWCKDVDGEQDEFWFYLPADKLRRVRLVQMPRGGSSQVVFLATEERMVVEGNSFGSKLKNVPPDPLHHPDKPTEKFRFWRRDSNKEHGEFWFYLPADQFDSLSELLQ